ncbi:MAG: NAD(P)-dependent oxidoreductase, partial [Acidobacteria bacterium]
MRIAFAGLGRMGAPMAANLLRAGHAVAVYNRTAGRTAELEALGATVAATPAAAAAGAELAVTML